MLPTVVLEQREETAGTVLSRIEAGTVLGVAANTVGKLLASGFLPDLAEYRVAALAGSRHVRVQEGRLPVLRTAAATAPYDAGDGRDFIGDAVFLTDDQFLQASRQWWRCDPDVIVQAGVLPVAVAGWVTGVLDVHAHEAATVRRPHEVRHSFTASVAGRVGTLDDPSTYRILATDETMASLTRQLLGSRVQSAVSGGPIAYLRPTPA
ncbi:hypothetical protein ACIO3O_41900 [Streptomyces sp. NPDC087440]|uniref:hypothetical protein n=1 Tax=Streptomyces sp. NPDC087440 TaxID=3365790 RepID=UPI0038024BA9